MTRASSRLLLFLAAIPSVQAQGPQPGDPVRLTLGPAAAPKPSLKYRLLPAPDRQRPGNSATLYYRAMTVFTENEALLVEIRQKHWDDWLEDPLRDLPLQEVGEKLRMARHLLAEIEQGSLRKRCDWQIEARSEGPGLLLPEVQSFRRVAVLLAVRARYHIAQKQWGQAIGTLATGFALARDLSRGPTLIHILVGAAIAQVMCKEVEELIQQPGAPNLYWALSALPRPFGDMGQAIEEERTMVERFFPLLRRAGHGPLTTREIQAGLDELRQRLDDLSLRRPTALEKKAQAALITWYHPEARRALLKQGWTAAQLDAMPIVQVVTLWAYRQYRETSDEALKWALVPGGLNHPGYKEDARRAGEAVRLLDRLFFRGLLAGLDGEGSLHLESFSGAVGRLDRRLAALRCLEALRLQAARDGGKWPGALQDIKEVPAPADPVTGKPFEYKPTEGGATLAAPLPPGPKSPAGYLLSYELTWRR